MNDFPIKTATACQLKWAWSTIFLNRGSTSSCHRVDSQKLTTDNFKNFHNLPEKINDRNLMMEGKRPSGGCEYCFKIEDAGGFSDRQNHLIFKDLTPKELIANINSVQVTPTILEVYFNNTCNLSCLYCGPHYSSVWENEYKKYGNIIGTTDDFTPASKWHLNKEYDNMVSQLWEWMCENSKHLKKFHILGGEPFYQKEFIDCLDHFENYPNPECEIVIITNLMVDDKKMDYYIERFKKLIGKRKIKNLQITCSLDCWGPQAEFIRSGLDLHQWERNFEKLLNIKWIRLQINHAINVLSIKHMPELLEKINHWNKTKKIYLQYMTVIKPDCLNPDIFGDTVFSEDLKKIIELIPANDEFDNYSKEYFIGMSKQILSSSPNLVKIKDLKIFLQEIDRRRNTDYRIYFPWLVQEFEKHLK
jgi:organic radical activating enzyme